MSLYNRKEPTKEQYEQERGDTTFGTCGWCEHVNASLCRYDCALEGSCGFVPREDTGEYSYTNYYSNCNDMSWVEDRILDVKTLGKKDIEYMLRCYDDAIDKFKERIKTINTKIKRVKALDTLGGRGLDKNPGYIIRRGQNVDWDTDCLMVRPSPELITEIVKQLKAEIEYFKTVAIPEHEHRRDVIKMLVDTAPGTPVLPYHRPHDHFSINDGVAVYFREDVETKDHGTVGKGWYSGEVRMGYRHQDGCVSYRLNGAGPQAGNDKDFPFRDGFWGQGMSTPTVMLLSEYQYFVDNPAEWVYWAQNACNQLFNSKTINPFDIAPPAKWAEPPELQQGTTRPNMPVTPEEAFQAGLDLGKKDSSN